MKPLTSPLLGEAGLALGQTGWGISVVKSAWIPASAGMTPWLLSFG